MSGPRSGLSSSLGFAVEPVYGQYTPVTRFAEFNKETLKRNKKVAQGMGLAAGRSVMHGGRRVMTTRDVTGDVTLDVVDRGLLALFANVMGPTGVTPVLQSGATSSYQAVMPFGSQVGNSLSVQKAVPSVDKATPQAFSYAGMKITDCEFSCGDADIFTAQMTFDGQEEYAPTDVAAKTLAAPSYPANMRPFVGTDATILITPSSTGTQVALRDVDKMSAKVSRSLKTDRHYFGSGPLKEEPIQNGFDQITGTLTADYYVDAAGVAKSLDSLFITDEVFALVWRFTGNTIETNQNTIWELTLPACRLDGNGPEVSGPDVIGGDYPFVCLTDDAGDMPSLRVVSRDATL